VSLVELRLGNLRCLQAADLTLHPRLNLITGANGSGKTSLLEAIYLLGRGRSFRTRYTEQLIQQSAAKLWVAGRTEGLAADDGRRIDLQCDRVAGVEARIDRQRASSLAELSEVFPVQIIDPGIHRLIEEGPARRRRWLDWAMFHVEPLFLSQWQSYTRALRQRNAALQAGSDPAPWELELSRLGEPLSASRARLIDALQPLWSDALRRLDVVPATLSFHAGWNREHSLMESLLRQRQGDRDRGSTRQGPHRFDVVLRVGAHPAREVISRGQQKLLGVAMSLCIARYVALAGKKPALLVDDPAAELDEAHTRALLLAVAELGGQYVVTALRAQCIPPIIPDRVFHVEQGGVKRL